VTQGVSIGTGTNPTASFTYSPQGPVPGQVINFNASGSRAAAGATIIAYNWDFGDGTPGASNVTTTHQFATTGQYIVTLTVTDNAGRIGTTTQTIQVGSDLPTAAFTVTPSSPARGTPVILNGTASTAVAGRTITGYSWSFVAPVGATPPAPTTGPTVSVTFTTAGTYSVTLTVTDSASPPRSASSTQTVTVTP
jgi:PKD repeat protein